MATPKHLKILKQGVDAWNAWRQKHPKIKINFQGADLSGADLRQANLSKVDLSGADLSDADLRGADLSDATLIMAHLKKARLRDADLSRATLIGAHLKKACLRNADLSDADLRNATLILARLRDADLRRARLVGADLRETIFMEATLKKADLSKTNMRGANLTGAYLEGVDFRQAKLNSCRIYGISAWDLNLAGAEQLDLIITPPNEPELTVDDLEVAQFIYLLLDNKKIRHVIETVTSKAVLILGRSTPERKAVLDALREALRTRDHLPIVFDFTLPRSQTTDETISTLAHMARFVIADLTDAKSVLQELRAIVPNSPSVLVQPILLASQEEPGMFDFFRRFPWALEP
jgi:uncharacterized protein YjbI with pentapeptide repeats